MKALIIGIILIILGFV